MILGFLGFLENHSGLFSDSFWALGFLGFLGFLGCLEIPQNSCMEAVAVTVTDLNKNYTKERSCKFVIIRLFRGQRHSKRSFYA